MTDEDEQRPTLLVLRALGLGDMLTGLPAMRALRAAFPDHRHLLATTPSVSPLALYSAVTDEIVPTAPLEALNPFLDEPDIAVDLHGRGPESHLVLADARPGRLIAFHCDEFDGPEWRADEHEVQRWCRLLEESGIPADPSQLDLDPGGLPVSPAVRQACEATLIHAGAGSAARRWPPDRFAKVAKAETEAGRRVVLTGGPGEVGLAREVAVRAGLDRSVIIAGNTPILELAACVAVAGRVVCGDTGVAHLATALRTPSVVLFGPVSPAQWGPPADRPWHVALWAGRTGDPHGATVDPGLLEISSRDVIAALEHLPGRLSCPPSPNPEMASNLADRLARFSAGSEVDARTAP